LTLVMGARPKLLSIFTHALSRMIHFCPLTPCMCQLGVRNVGLKRTSRILKKVMVESGEVYLQQVPVEVEVKIASSWA
ncbi:hypothetical protein, partial [Microcoleus sp.]|uniref:hypothetical protein n=1 Tax=Microcoleus sp. TaxID=44472 RepID=UPI0035237E26